MYLDQFEIEMPRRKNVPSLRRICLNGSIRDLVNKLIDSLANRLFNCNKNNNNNNDNDAKTMPVVLIDNQAFNPIWIDEVRSYLLDGVPRNLAEDIVAIFLKELGKRIDEERNFPDDSAMRNVTMRISEVCIWPRISKIDLSAIPRQIRIFLYHHLNRLPRNSLRYLDLGGGIGTFLTSPFLDSFFKDGISDFSRLSVFRLHNDCTNSILEAVVRASGGSLRVIDVQYSRFIDSNEALLEVNLPNIIEVVLTGTFVNAEKHADLLVKLSSESKRGLQVFAVDDFGDVLLAVKERYEKPASFSIRDFRPPRDLTQGSLYQEPSDLALLSQMCPELRKICVDFDLKETDYGEFIQRFESLQHLIVVGGRSAAAVSNYFIASLKNSSRICSKLTTLELIHLDGISFSDHILPLAELCPNLKSLSMSNCHFSEDHFYCDNIARDYSWPSLSRIVFESRRDAGGKFLPNLVKLCKGITELHCGIQSGIDDTMICQLLDFGLGKKLQIFNLEFSDSLSMFGVFQIVQRCKNLKVLKDIYSFVRVSTEEVAALRSWIKDHNIFLATE